MNLTASHRGHYHVLTLNDAICLSTDISFLAEAVEHEIAAGHHAIAFEFTVDSFLYSHHIAVLVRCIELVREQQGTLCAINPNKDIKEVLQYLDLEKTFKIVNSADELESLSVP